jgi:hypothetical protein
MRSVTDPLQSPWGNANTIIGTRAPYFALCLITSAFGCLPQRSIEVQLTPQSSIPVRAETIFAAEQYDRMLEKEIADVKKLARCLKSERCMKPMGAPTTAFLSQLLRGLRMRRST